VRQPGDDVNVLDPFAGTGTVGRVAADLGRRALLIELRPEYGAMAKRKTAQLGLVP
jgi:DNA modification methylase